MTLAPLPGEMSLCGDQGSAGKIQAKKKKKCTSDKPLKKDVQCRGQVITDKHVRLDFLCEESETRVPVHGACHPYAECASVPRRGLAVASSEPGTPGGQYGRSGKCDQGQIREPLFCILL